MPRKVLKVIQLKEKPLCNEEMTRRNFQACFGFYTFVLCGSAEKNLTEDGLVWGGSVLNRRFRKNKTFKETFTLFYSDKIVFFPFFY